MTRAIFKIKGMHCGSCSMLINMALSELDGVQSVECEYATASAVVTFDDARVSVAQLRQGIVDNGYQAEPVIQ